MKDSVKIALGGAVAGAVNGAFGGGGGMVLLPMLTAAEVEEKKSFATCVAVILPLCAVSAAMALWQGGFDWRQALPYLLGGLVGGAVGGFTMGKVDVKLLRYLFAAFMVYGGIRYLT